MIDTKVKALKLAIIYCDMEEPVLAKEILEKLLSVIEMENILKK
jgi:hypothetical protein